MPNRATESEVLALLDTDLEAEDITPFLNAANGVVSDECLGVEYSDEKLRDIEMWLAAHFVCARDPQIAEEKIGDATWKFDGKTDLGLDSTRYGQRLKIIDSKKTLAGLDTAKGAVEIQVLG
jgi:hypothetical protein